MSEIDLTDNTSVLYSQEVTADDLNNMVKDLGLTDFTEFTEFEDGTETTVTRLNDITKALVTKGILQFGSMCKVTVNDSYIYVTDGICVFEDGSKVRLKASYTLSKYSGTNYVYLAKVAAGGAKLINTTSELSSTGYVDIIPLAIVSADGTVTDKRIRAQARFDNKNGQNYTDTKTLTLFYPTGKTNGEYTYYENVFDVGFGGFNYVRTEFENKLYFVYIGDNVERAFINSSGGGSWIRKEGNSIIIKTGTWDKYGSRNQDVEIFLF